MLKIPDAVESQIAKADMVRLSVEDYRLLGVAVLRNCISKATMSSWQKAWAEFQDRSIGEGRKVNPFNPVVLNENVTGELTKIYRHPELLDIMEQVYPDLGIFGQRFVIKDRHSRTPVFPHQDYGYDLGWPEKTSVFLPLSEMNPDNGGLFFLPGTHLAGFLGDAGEIDLEMLAPGWPAIAPTVSPGDIVLMHECTWHGSGPHKAGPDRIVVQIQYQPASDPSSTETLRGRNAGLVQLTDEMRHLIFSRSRSSRLKELQIEINALKAHPKV